MQEEPEELVLVVELAEPGGQADVAGVRAGDRIVCAGGGRRRVPCALMRYVVYRYWLWGSRYRYWLWCLSGRSNSRNAKTMPLQ